MKLHAVVDGAPEAPVLVLASSLGTTLEMWEPQLAALTQRFRVVRFDRRGHGRSPLASGPTTVDDLGRDLIELLDELSLERVSFCGLSLGGVEGMWLAINAPGRIGSLALCCTAASFPPRQAWLDRAAAVRGGGLQAISEAVLGRWFTPAFRDACPDVVSRLRVMLESIPVEGYASCCEALADADLTAQLGEISVPTLVITGADDPVAPPEMGDALAAAIPAATHIVIAGAAHVANVEQPAAFTEALLRHLGEERK